MPDTPAAPLGHNCLTVSTLPQPNGWWCFPDFNNGAALPVKGSLPSDDAETLVQVAIGRAAINAVRKPGRSHAAKARLFIAHLRAQFGEPCYWDRALDLFQAGEQ